MSDNGLKHVFVVATARTGGTWIGKVLDTSPAVKYMWEPDNHRRPKMKRFRHWEHGDPEKIRARVEGFVAHQHIPMEFPKIGIETAVYKMTSICGDAAFIVDEWIEEFLRVRHALGAKVIHVIRHPVRWAASVQRWGNRPLDRMLEVYGRGNARFRMRCVGQPWYKMVEHGMATMFPKRILPSMMDFCGLECGDMFWKFMAEMHTEDRNPEPDKHSVVMRPKTVMQRWESLSDSEIELANHSTRQHWEHIFTSLKRGDTHA